MKRIYLALVAMCAVALGLAQSVLAAPPVPAVPADMQIDWVTLVGTIAGLLVVAIGAVIGLKLGFVLIRAAYRWLAGIASGR